MGCPKKSTKQSRINLSKTLTHKCHQAAHDQAPEGVKKSGDLLENTEKEELWIDEMSIENAQEEAWSTSSNSLSVVLLDGEEDDSHPSNRQHLNMMLSKGMADWYQDAAEKKALSQRPCHYSGNSHMSKWRASKDAEKNGQTILDAFKHTVSPQMQG
jgi:hypothetical protein